MSTPKDHHTTPIVYLKNFAETDGRLTLFSKRQEKQYRPLPDKALTRRYYYSQPLEGELNAAHEIETKLLHGLEDRYNDLYNQLLCGGSVDLDLLIQTLASMRARSPAFREAFEIGLADFVMTETRTIPKGLLPTPPDGIPDILEKTIVTIDPHRSLAAMAHYVRNYFWRIANCSYSIVVAPKGCEFLTSDNPVLWFERDRKLGNETIYSNFPSSKTRVFFPLNKTTALKGRLRRENEPPFRHGEKTLSTKEIRVANEMQLACAWDAVVGTANLPRRSRKYYERLAPYMKIAGFNPDRDEFFLEETSLKPLRTKYKFRHSK